MVRRALDIVVSATAIAALTLTGCGTDNNAPSGKGSSGKPAVDCGGKNELTAEGSTAQQNAIALFNRAWGQSCPGKSLAYNPTGSGFQGSTPKAIDAFRAALERRGLRATLRLTRGRDIEAACGQLAVQAA